MIMDFDSHSPVIAKSAWIADNATVIGRVEIGAESSVWFQTVVRGDVHWIRIGERTNVQDGCIIHVTTDTHPTILEDDVTIGHGVVLHGCTVESGALVGIGSVVMDAAVIGKGALVAAGSLVTPRTVIPPYTLAVGRPAKPKRALTAEERAHLAEHAGRYVALSRRYLAMSR